MLELKNLTKIYHTSKMNTVTALDKVSFTLPDSGMVFLLGKSGSGKTTLLNLIGALDTVSAGDILINGEAFSKFKPEQLDFYRNTYIGFIFQEYNLLDAFSVGENISLALDLQQKTSVKEKVKEVLALVGLEGLEERSPKELSGGQKQRVAIARSIVKDPQIIMADEPTGALDSETGKQVLETLKTLSADRLVIVVTHDREAAESYGDRIIELSDGKVINDTKPSVNKMQSPEKQAAMIRASLPAKTALRIGVNGIFHKKFRFLTVVLLSLISLVLFGVSDMLSAYNKQRALIDTLADAGVSYASVYQEKWLDYGDSAAWYRNGFKISEEELETLSRKTDRRFIGVYVPPFIDLNIERNYKSTGAHNNYGTYVSELSGFVTFTEEDMKDFGYTLAAGRLPDGDKDEIAISEYLYASFAESGYAYFTGMQYELFIDNDMYGTPDKVISWDEYRTAASEYRKDGILYDGVTYGRVKCTVPVTDKKKIETYEDLISETIFIANRNYTITGIIDTGFDAARYADLKESDTEKSDEALAMGALMRRNELDCERNYGLICAVFVGEGKVEEIASRFPSVVTIDDMTLDFENEDISYINTSIARLSDIDLNALKMFRVRADVEEVFLEGASIELTAEEKASLHLEEKEIIEYQEILAEFQTRNNVNMALSYEDDRNSAFDEGYQYIADFFAGELWYDEYLMGDTVLVSDALFAQLSEGREGTYSYAVCAMPEGKTKIKQLISRCNETEEDIRYPVVNAISFELNTLDETLRSFAGIFRYAGLGLAAFAVMLFFNFISVSITHKKKEIGILRALGAGKREIFKIFALESLILSLLDFVLSCILTGAAAYFGNGVLQEKFGVLLSILHFGIRQVAVVLVLSILTAVISSAVPIKKIVSQKPIEVIRDN